ncbi:MAG: Lrp/AsnC ligand binding domain-containing protein [Desulfatiglandaceae bacterium]|jgi:DNA-binding Lrp family transcriptional regulator
MNNFIDRILNIWKVRRSPDEVKDFEEEQRQEEAFESVKRGIHSVPLDQIVGSVGRYHDFDSRFRPKQHVPRERLEHIRDAMRNGKPLLPVKLYQIKDEYFVLDGNHRISVAKELGLSEIDARIVELIPSRNTLENILYREGMDFREKTGLPEAIALTEVGQYAHLMGQIFRHQRFLEKTGKTPVTLEDASSDWYKTIYSPLLAIVERGGLIKFFPKRTSADLYTYISYHQWEKDQSRRYGIGIDRLIPKDMEAFRKNMAKMKKFEYPEMKREITAFILMRVKPKEEFRIMDKLFALREVEEVHSVHGDVDILVKIVLTRDLLASDAEIIGQFVHDAMRNLQGVVSTQTLIPGSSKIKGSRRDQSNE